MTSAVINPQEAKLILIVASCGVFERKISGRKINSFILNKNLKKKRLDFKGYLVLTLCNEVRILFSSSFTSAAQYGPQRRL